MIGHYTRLAKRSTVLSLGTVSEACSVNFTLLFMPMNSLFYGVLISLTRVVAGAREVTERMAVL